MVVWGCCTGGVIGLMVPQGMGMLTKETTRTNADDATMGKGMTAKAIMSIDCVSTTR